MPHGKARPDHRLSAAARLDSRQLSESVAASIRASYPRLSPPRFAPAIRVCRCRTAVQLVRTTVENLILSSYHPRTSKHVVYLAQLAVAGQSTSCTRAWVRPNTVFNTLARPRYRALLPPPPASPPAVRERQQAAAFVGARAGAVRVGVADPRLCAPRVRISTVSSCSACGRGLLAVGVRAGGCA